MFVFCGCNSSHCHCCDVFLALRATPVRWLVTTSRCLNSFVRKGSRMCWRLCLLRRAPESAPTSKSKSFPEVQISISQPSTHSVTQCTNIFYRKSLHAHWNMFSDWVRVWMTGRVLSQISAAERLSFIWSPLSMNPSGQTMTSVAPKAMISARSPVLIG